jgi:hypothetical protein
MVALPRSKLEHGGDVVRLEVWVIGKNLGSIRAGRQEIQHILHTNAHATYGRPAATDVWIDGNAVNLGHRFLSKPVLYLTPRKLASRVAAPAATRHSRDDLTLSCPVSEFLAVGCRSAFEDLVF